MLLHVCSAVLILASAPLLEAEQTPTTAATQGSTGVPAAAQKPRPERPKKPGVTKSGVQIPMAKLKPESEYLVGGAPDWLAITDVVYVSNMPKNSVVRIDSKEGKVLSELTGFNKPCSGLAVGFGSLWVPNCGDGTLSRVDLKTGNKTAFIQTGVADSEGGIAVSPDSVWIMTKPDSTLARIDPMSNKVVAEIPLPTGCYTAAFGMDSVWVTCTETNQLIRVDPTTNLITAQIKTGAQPRFLAVGEGAVWTLNQATGTVTRVDAQTNKVVATIEVGVPGPGGDIAAGEGSVWVTSFQYPLSRIDPDSNEVVQQFVGVGGDAVRAANGNVWLTDLAHGKVWKFDPKLIAATISGN